MTIGLKLGVYTIFSVYVFLAAGLLIMGIENPFCWGIGLSIVLLALLAFLYIHGINTQSSWSMLPFLVSELIVRLFVAMALIISWIAYLLAIFDQITAESPIEFMSIDQFLLLISVLISVLFLVMLRFYFTLYNEYRDIKKLNDRRRMERNNELEEDSQYMKLHFSARPTDL